MSSSSNTDHISVPPVVESAVAIILKSSLILCTSCGAIVIETQHIFAGDGENDGMQEGVMVGCPLG